MPRSRLRQDLATLVALPSVTCTQPEQDMPNIAVIEQLAQWFTEAGFNCEILPVSHGKANLVAVRAAHNGITTGGLVLAGHTDTVPCDIGLWQSNPFKMSEREGQLYGLGTADMKGFFALILDAVRKFKHTPLKAPLIIIATCDEETSMAGAHALLHHAKAHGRFTLLGEPTSLKPARMHKGIMLERIVITGQAGHSSDPALGNNALDAMHDMIGRLMRFREQLKTIYNPAFPVPHPTLNLGCIHGGDNPNRICGICELQFDLRPLPNMNMQALRADIAGLVEQTARQFGIHILYEPATPDSPPAETPADSVFVQKIEQLTGKAAGAVGFATEAPFFNQMGMDTVILGPGNIKQAHQPDEYLSLAAIPPMLLWLGQLIHFYCVQGHAAWDA